MHVCVFMFYLLYTSNTYAYKHTQVPTSAWNASWVFNNAFCVMVVTFSSLSNPYSNNTLPKQVRHTKNIKCYTLYGYVHLYI